MKRSLLTGMVLGLLSLSTSAFAQIFFTASLDSTQEPSTVGPVPGKGTGSFALNDARTELSYQITVTGLSGPILAAHFHNGPPGVIGGVVRGVTFTNNTASGIWKSTDAQALTDSMVRELIRGRIYFNVHTTANSGGEIRGVLNLTSGVGFTAALDSAQEPSTVGPVPGKGTGSFTLNAARTELAYNITVNGLSGNILAAHFHNGSPGVIGGVVRGVTFTGNTASGIWKNTDSQALTDSMVSQLLKGRIYFNVHTTANSGGEIRGVLNLTTGIAFTASLDSTQEPSTVGPVPGTGTGSFALNDARTELSYQITVTGLSGPILAAHFHNGPPGVIGGVVRGVTFTNNTASGIWKSTDAQALTDSLVRELIRGRIYFNVHTTANSGGEIRGVLNLTSGVGFTAALDSAQEPSTVGPVPGKGSGSFTLNAARTELAYNITVNGLSGPILAAHFHNGSPGVVGGVVRGVTFTGNTASGIWKNTDSQALTDSMVSQLLKGRIYFNVHTTANSGGEIRGVLGIGSGKLPTSVEQLSVAIPASFTLQQNYPNPFNPTTVIQFQVQKTARVTLKVYDVLGQEVATLLDDVKPAGTYTATFNAGSFASGVYFYRLSSDGGFRESRKMLLLK